MCNSQCHPLCCQTLINGTLEIPCQKPPIEEITNVTLIPIIKRVITIDGKVIVRGTVKINIEYVADVEDGSQPVHFAHFYIDFDCFIDVPWALKGMKLIVEPEIEYYEVKRIGCKTISKLIIVKVCVPKKY